MTVEELPLLDLFTQLREAGLPLGIHEYQLVLRALQGGFGVSDRAALKRLCQTLWVKSPEDKRLFDYNFKLFVGQDSSVSEGKDGQDAQPTTEISDKTEIKSAPAESTPEPTPKPAQVPEASTPEPTTTPALSPELTLEIEDETQAAKAVLQAGSRDDEIPYNRFILTAEYFPVTRRQMKQSWRYLRRPVREGAATELDVEATVSQIGREGILLEPVLVPRRINRAELLLLIDQDGSMVPFHALSHRLAETAMRGGRLGKAGIYYFHNCPVEYLYHDPHRVEAEAISDMLARISERSAVLIFSDAGAARGGYSSERIELTLSFLNQLKTKVRYIAWLNPMPKSRWDATTAGEVAPLVPMFEVSRRGLQDAIDVLRGR